MGMCKGRYRGGTGAVYGRYRGGMSEKSLPAGYGGMAPRTTAGRMFTIVYAIPGMAIMMAYLGQFSMVIVIVLHKVSIW